MSNYKKRYSLRERKADELWATWQPEEGTPAFWQAYDQLLLRARKAQKNVVISQANASIPPPIKRKTLPSATKSPLFRTRAYILAFTIVSGLIAYVLANAIAIPQKDPAVEAMLSDIRIEQPSTSSLDWKSFKADQSFKTDFDPNLPDSLAIAYYKKRELPHTIRAIEDKLKPHKKMIREARQALQENNTTENLFALERLKKNYESLWENEERKLEEMEQELKHIRQWYKQTYEAYLKVRRNKVLSMVNYQRLEEAWHELIHSGEYLQNVSWRNQPVYDLRTGRETTWLFAVGFDFTLFRVMHYKGEYFAIEGNKLKPLHSQKDIYKAEIKVYYQGQLVTYTPQKIYYELNGKQHNIAIKDFDKLEKRMEVSKYQPLVKQ